MLGGISGQTRDLMTEGSYGAFEQAVEKRLGQRIRASKSAGRALWSALANVRWVHPKHGEVAYSWRSAGDLIAAIRKQGDYMDWYMSGPEAKVATTIVEPLKREGWSHKFYEE